MKLYEIWQIGRIGYDMYEGAIVCAENEEAARRITPRGEELSVSENDGSWPSMKDIDRIRVRYIGEAAQGIERGVILASSI